MSCGGVWYVFLGLQFPRPGFRSSTSEIRLAEAEILGILNDRAMATVDVLVVLTALMVDISRGFLTGECLCSQSRAVMLSKSLRFFCRQRNSNARANPVSVVKR